MTNLNQFFSFNGKTKSCRPLSQMAGLIVILLYTCKLAFLTSSTCVKIKRGKDGLIACTQKGNLWLLLLRSERAATFSGFKKNIQLFQLTLSVQSVKLKDKTAR